MAKANMPERVTGDNSNKAREKTDISKSSAKPLEKGKARMRSKSLAMKFAEMFFEGSIHEAVDYMINDVAKPQIKNAILKGIEIIFFGGTNSSLPSRGVNSPTPYNSYWVAKDGSRRPANSSGGTGSRNSNNNTELNRLRKAYDPKLIVVEDRGEAQRILSDLRNDCNDFGQVGVDRLFELVNITSDWTSTKYGWVRGDLDDAKVRPCGNGWWFDLPDPIVID